MAVQTSNTGPAGLFTDDQPDYRNDWSFCAWYRATSGASGNTLFAHDKTAGSGGSARSFTIWRNNGFNRWALKVADTSVFAADNSYPLDTWHHVALVHDSGADEARLYVDGALLLTRSGFAASDWNNSTSQQRLWIAIEAFGGTSPSFGGDQMVEQAKLWNVLLSLEEIQAERRSSAPVKRTNLWAWWPLIPQSSLWLLDYSGNGRNLTNTSTAPTAATLGAPARFRRTPPALVPDEGGETTLEPTGLATTSVFGAPTIVETLQPEGLASTSAFGSPTLEQVLQPTGLASASGFGSPALAMTVEPAGLASSSSFGSPTLTLFLEATGIASTSVFGEPSIEQILLPAGMASSSALGSPTILADGVLVPPGLASTSAFGQPTLVETVFPTGLASQAAFGLPTLVETLLPSGLTSTSAFGEPTLVNVLLPAGLVTTSSFGSPTVLAGEHVLQPPGLPSTSEFGSPVLIKDQILQPTGLASTSAFGFPILNPGAVDRLGQPVVIGDDYVLVGTLRRIELNGELLLVLGGGQFAVRVNAADVVRIDDLTA